MLFADVTLAARIEHAECSLLANVLGKRLPAEGMRAPSPGVEVAPSGADELATWIDVVATGFAAASMRIHDGVCGLHGAATLPGSKSQQNVQRLGFDLLYARAILVLER